jgi:hypothetical protein
MKKLLLILTISVFLFSSCSSELVNKNGEDMNLSCEINSKNVIVVEGCEYFVIAAYGSNTYLHKGNCSNPIHYCKCDSICQKN